MGGGKIKSSKVKLAWDLGELRPSGGLIDLAVLVLNFSGIGLSASARETDTFFQTALGCMLFERQVIDGEDGDFGFERCEAEPVQALEGGAARQCWKELRSLVGALYAELPCAAGVGAESAGDDKAIPLIGG